MTALTWLRDVVVFGSHTEHDAVSVLAMTRSDAERQSLTAIALCKGWHLRFAANEAESVGRLQERGYGVVLLDRDFAGGKWREQVREICRLAPGCCVVLMSGVDDDCLWQEVVRQGGYDVVSKPLRETQVEAIVKLAWSYWKQRLTQRAASHA